MFAGRLSSVAFEMNRAEAPSPRIFGRRGDVFPWSENQTKTAATGFRLLDCDLPQISK
jgi:hypothetical protein